MNVEDTLSDEEEFSRAATRSDITSSGAATRSYITSPEAATRSYITSPEAATRSYITSPEAAKRSCITSSVMHSKTNCDICNHQSDSENSVYCPLCKQNLCDVCTVVHNRLAGTQGHVSSMIGCDRECKPLDKSLLDKIAKAKGMNIQQLSTFIIEELGIQVRYKVDDGTLEIRAPYQDVLELALSTISDMATVSEKSIEKQIHHGKIEWRMKEQFAETVLKLFQNELSSLVENYGVEIQVRRGTTKLVWPLERTKCISKSNSDVRPGSIKVTDTGSKILELIIICSFEDYYPVDCEIEGIKDEVQTLMKVEVLRPKCDEFRMKMYEMLQEENNSVLCRVEPQENILKLIIEGREPASIERVKQEFLCLFCKECSACGSESARPTYLECKHVLCTNCLRVTRSTSASVTCPLCSDADRQKTPVSSLRLQCIQAIDKHLEKSLCVNHHKETSRRKSSIRSPQFTIKIPKYLLNKWKKITGGITRLRSLIENDYGFKVAGSEDNLRIYGQQQEVLELAVQTLERLNDKTPETGVTQRLSGRCIEWRFRGHYGRILYFLFNKELQDLKKKFKSVTVQVLVFTESEPVIVDVKCGYEEYLKVLYEIEELENEIRNLYTDEYIQPKNFYHGVKLDEYLYSKRRDVKVHCSLIEKNNLNVVVIRGRKKEYVNSAKEQLQKW